MESFSLHPFDERQVVEFVAALQSERSQDPTLSSAIAGLAQARATGRESATYPITHALGLVLAREQPSFAFPGLSLSTWEARIDRGVGMMMRPPSRLFVDAGLDQSVARLMPIRLDMSRGLMGGAWIPARLMAQFEEQLHRRQARVVRRIAEGEVAPPEVYAVMVEAVRYARERNLSLYEAADVIEPSQPATWPPGARVIGPDLSSLDQVLLKQIREDAKPPKKPGLLSRLFRREQAAPNPPWNGA